MQQQVEILISAMHQVDCSIFERTNVKTDALLINQCDKEQKYSIKRNYGTQRVISTTQRGLSRSRNMALDNANGEICLICDDDEVLIDNYEQLIINAFNENPEYDILCFMFQLKGKEFPKYSFKVNYLNALKITSWQIAFKKNRIIDKNIRFDEKFGSGTPIGSGEENIFLYDCLKQGLKIKYLPICIGHVAQEESHWFRGFDEEYFLNRGKIIKRLMGVPWGLAYCIYFILFKTKEYKDTISMRNAWRNIIKGYIANE